MTIQECIRSGKRFKRKGWTSWLVVMSGDICWEDDTRRASLHNVDILADDLEVEPFKFEAKIREHFKDEHREGYLIDGALYLLPEIEARDAEIERLKFNLSNYERDYPLCKDLRDKYQRQLTEALEVIRLMTARAGNPDPQEACRLVIQTARDFLKRVGGGK